MLGILLMILKVIGVILLGILGLFITLVLLVLFLPVTYRVWVSGDSGEPDTFSYRVRILGIQVLPKKEKKERKRRKTKCHEKQDVPDTPPVSEGRVEKLPEEAQESSKTERQPGASRKIKKEQSGRDVRRMLEQLHAEFTDEGNKRALKHLLSELRYLLHHFGPRRVRADVSFSLGDPANTGYATAALSICPFSYGKDCRIIPDFETEQLYLRGWLDLKGHVRIIYVVAAGIRLLFDRNIRVVIKKILKKK